MEYGNQPKKSPYNKMRRPMVSSDFDLSGKVAIVTGGSRGLGKAMALGLAQSGAHIVICDLLDTKETVSQIQQLGQESIGLKVDVTRSNDVEMMVKKTIDTFQTIDILVNNAGIEKGQVTEKMTEEDWKKTLDVNLTGEFLCAKAVGKQMIQQKHGRIINIASVAGILGSTQSAAYCASKAGIILLTKTLAIEWGKHGINVNAICPGIFRTDMTENYIKDSGFAQMITARIPLGRYARPEELIGTVVFLASNASSYITGHTLIVDGGWTAGL
jgi:NAD(P)-dependent dehydrogenase (short-subunit alcohol dehydrogenase family)